MWILALLAHVGVIAIAYGRRDSPEDGLVLKLVGYLLLGLFTLTIDRVRLPLGFTIDLIFFNKECINARAKFTAVLFGLLGFMFNLLFIWR